MQDINWSNFWFKIPSYLRVRIKLIRIIRSIAGGSTTNDFAVGNASGSRPRGTMWTATNNGGYDLGTNFAICDKSHNTTSAITYKVELIGHCGCTAYFNYRSNHNDANGYSSTMFSTIMAQELGHTITDA